MTNLVISINCLIVNDRFKIVCVCEGVDVFWGLNPLYVLFLCPEEVPAMCCWIRLQETEKVETPGSSSKIETTKCTRKNKKKKYISSSFHRVNIFILRSECKQTKYVGLYRVCIRRTNLR